MLLFDPTRGIDVGTKHQVYDLVRALADEGAAIVMFTSELREVGLVCDRSAVLHNGRIVAELPADAGESALLSAAHGLEVGRRMTDAITPGSFDGATHDAAGAVEPAVPLRPAAGLDGRRRRAARRAAAVAGLAAARRSATSRSARSPPARCRWRSWPWPRAWS